MKSGVGRPTLTRQTSSTAYLPSPRLPIDRGHSFFMLEVSVCLCPMLHSTFLRVLGLHQSTNETSINVVGREGGSREGGTTYKVDIDLLSHMVGDLSIAIDRPRRRGMVISRNYIYGHI